MRMRKTRLSAGFWLAYCLAKTQPILAQIPLHTGESVEMQHGRHGTGRSVMLDDYLIGEPSDPAATGEANLSFYL